MKIKYRLRQRRSYRTRIQFYGLRNNPQVCKKLEGCLSELDGVALVEVRPLTGSIILCHPQRFIAVDEIIAAVASENNYGSRRVSGAISESKKNPFWLRAGLQP